jgi:hypothetical protein
MIEIFVVVHIAALGSILLKLSSQEMKTISHRRNVALYSLMKSMPASKKKYPWASAVQNQLKEISS